MSAPKVIVSTCGTSLLTYQVAQELRKLINQYANNSESTIPQEAKSKLQQRLAEQKTVLEEANLATASKMSAELNGIISYYNNELSQGKRGDQHYLIVSDTFLGKEVGKAIQVWLEKQGLNTALHETPGLVANDLDNFRSAMSDLIQWCEEALKPWGKENVIFNLTGGFKGTQGFMQTLGMFYAEESVYIFEGSSLLRIPRLPVRLDTDQVILDNADAFRQLGNGQDLEQTMVSGIPETLLTVMEGRALLSPWGDLIWEQGKHHLYQSELLEPLANLRFAEGFEKEVKKQNLTSDQLSMLNRRLDQLHLVVRDPSKNVKGLDFKSLVGNPRPPSTHECDIWSGDERRLFGHFEEDIFVIDSIARGLH